jgi:tRNA (mo5U34)-methyltransferase
LTEKAAPGSRRVATLASHPPTGPDDPRLQGWYHTIELGDGVLSNGVYDLRSVVDQYGLPESLEGKTALDIGTADGFWAFEMERRGADRVVATDIARVRDLDLLPSIRDALGERADQGVSARFKAAHALRGSRVEHMICSVYDLSPESVGVFDVVFCGSLLLHLQNPLGALVKIHSVTNEMAIVETLLKKDIDEQFPEKPWLAFGYREHEATLGEECIYWRFSTQALREMMEYAGFGRSEGARFNLPSAPGDHWRTVVIGYP